MALIVENAAAVCESASHFWPGSCETPLRVTIHNGLDLPLDVRRLTLVDESRQSRIEWRFENRLIEAGGAWRFEQPVLLAEGNHRLLLSAIGEAGRPREAATRFAATNPARAAAEQRCRACHGELTARGILGIARCHCRMRDAGMPCDDGADCEGKCLATDGGFVCSEFRTVFGCHSYLPNGWSQRPRPPPPRLVRIPHLCVD